MRAKIVSAIRESAPIIYTLATWYTFSHTVLEISQSEGLSMHPTIDNQAILFVDKFLWRFTGLNKNDIIVGVQPINADLSICKRVCQLEGEEAHGMKVPAGHVWLQGDNKNGSFDSRNHGPVPMHLINGRVFKFMNV